MKRILIAAIVCLIGLPVCAQHIAIKNNLVFDATLTPNLGLEFALGKKITLDISGNYNPFTFSDNKKFQHWLAQPELRFWTCEKFAGTYFGIHALAGEYDVANIDLPSDWIRNLANNRFEGYFYGGGVSVGHQWVLGKRWNLEASIGAGYARVEYDKYGPLKSDPKKDSGTYNYFGVTKASLSLIYIIR